MGLKFKSIPLTEVSLKLAPNVPLPVDLESLAKLIGNKPAGSKVRTISDPHSGFGRACVPVTGQVYGCEFALRSGTRLIYQSNLLKVLWSNYSLREGRLYPSYSALRVAMDKLQSWVGEVWVPEEGETRCFQASNVQYTNFVATESPATSEDVARYIKNFPRQRGLAGRVLHEYNVCWKENDVHSTDVRVKITAASNPTSEYGFELETSAGHFAVQDDDSLSELDHDHACLETLFTALVTPTAKREWMKR